MDATAVIAGRGPTALHAIDFCWTGPGRAGHGFRMAGDAVGRFPVWGGWVETPRFGRVRERGSVILDPAAFERFAREGARLRLQGRRRAVALDVPARLFAEAWRKAHGMDWVARAA